MKLGRYRNKKSGFYYTITGTRINATNAQNGQVMVDYEDGNKYCREIKEFNEKFEE